MSTKQLLAVGVLLLSGIAAAQTAPATQHPRTAARKPAAKSAAKTPAKPGATLTTDKEKASYAIGMNIGTSMKSDGLDIDPAILGKGLQDAFNGAKTQMTPEEMHAALQKMAEQMRAKQVAMRQEKATKSKQEGEAFLAANKTKEGVVALPSGLQYKILQAGTGRKPTAADTVVCQYRGTLLDGTEFDSSYKRNEPATFPVSGVIKGWTEALQLMPVGSKWQLFIPPSLAYGDNGAGRDIPPNSTLIFEVELVSIQGSDAAKEPSAPAEAPKEAPKQ